MWCTSMLGIICFYEMRYLVFDFANRPRLRCTLTYLKRAVSLIAWRAHIASGLSWKVVRCSIADFFADRRCDTGKARFRIFSLRLEDGHAEEEIKMLYHNKEDITETKFTQGLHIIGLALAKVHDDHSIHSRI